MSETRLNPRPRIELFREAKALGDAMSIKVSPAAKPSRDEGKPTLGRALLDRSTARRETGLPGISGRVFPKLKGKTETSDSSVNAKARRSGKAEVSAFDGNSSLLYLARTNQQARQKPKKLYDQNAAALSKGASARGKAAKKKAKGENAKLVLAFMLLIALGAGLYASLPQVTRVRAVSVDGMKNVLQKEIIEALSLSEEINLINADVPAMEARILANPKVASVNIGRAFPDKLMVKLVERRAVACVLITEELGTRSVALDKDGVAFAYMDSIASSGKLPVLSGIRFESFSPGQSLPEYLRPLLRDIAELSELSPSPLEAFSEIRIEKISESEAELLLFPSGKAVPVRMPARLTRASLGSALLVLDILAGRQGFEKIEEIDFRTGTIVYRSKEAQAG
jgi:cell division protein FtsQ